MNLGMECSVQGLLYTVVLCIGDQCDRTLNTTVENQYIVWGMGGLEETAFIHFARAQSERDTHRDLI